MPWIVIHKRIKPKVYYQMQAPNTIQNQWKRSKLQATRPITFTEHYARQLLRVYIGDLTLEINGSISVVAMNLCFRTSIRWSSENKSTEMEVRIPGLRAGGHPVMFLPWQEGIIAQSNTSLLTGRADSTIFQQQQQ